MHSKSIALKIIIFAISLNILTGQTDFAKSEYQKAFAEYKAKKYNEAVTILEPIEQANPYYLDASLLLADTYIALENYGRANAIAEKLIKYYPNNPKALERTLKINLLQYDKTKAENIISQIKKIDSKNYYAAYAEGVIAEKQGHTKTALSLYENARKLDRTKTEANASLAYIYLIQGQKERALSLFKENLTLEPQNELSYYNLANYYYQNSMYPDAATKIEEAYYYYPLYPEAKILEIQILSKLKRYDDAVKIINSTDDNTFKGMKYYLLGTIYEDKNDYENAKLNYSEYIKKNPNDELARFAYERNLIKTTGSKINAERQRAAQYYAPTAKRYANMGDMERAQFYYKRMLRLNPSDINARLGLSDLYNKKGYFQKYLEELEIAKNIKPEDKNVAYRYESDKRKLERTIPSIAWGISQYNVPESGMSVAVINNIEAKDSSRYLSELAAAEAIANAMNQYPRINVISLYTNSMTKSEFLNKADQENIDFYIEGSMSEDGDALSINVSLIDRITRTPLAKFSAKNSGSEKLSKSALSIASQISKTIPHYGKIIKINGSSIYINAGKRQGITNKTEYAIYQGTPAFSINDKNISTNGVYMIGVATVEQADENVSLIKLTDTRALKNIRLNQFVIPYTPSNTNTNRNRR